METAQFWVDVRDNGKLIKSWIETLDWDDVDSYEEEQKKLYPNYQVTIGEWEYN